MNSRIRKPIHPNLRYKDNPDDVINTSGRKLLNIMSKYDTDACSKWCNT